MDIGHSFNGHWTLFYLLYLKKYSLLDVCGKNVDLKRENLVSRQEWADKLV